MLGLYYKESLFRIRVWFRAKGTCRSFGTCCSHLLLQGWQKHFKCLEMKEGVGFGESRQRANFVENRHRQLAVKTSTFTCWLRPAVYVVHFGMPCTRSSSGCRVRGPLRSTPGCRVRGPLWSTMYSVPLMGWHLIERNSLSWYILNFNTICWQEVLLKLSLCLPVLSPKAETEFWVSEKRMALLRCQAKGATVG